MIGKSNNDGKSPALPVNGLLLLNKPAGLTSNQALQKVKRLLGAKKAGHTGSLDPAATGMLPLCFGEATKVCAFLLDADKSYRVTARLGEATDTADGDGQVTASAAVPDLTGEEWERILQGFGGESTQIPPMYSALKHGGKRLYELARKGQVVERQPRSIRIDEICLLEAGPSRLVFRVRCSKGTYIRTLVEDIAAVAGTVAFTANLHRESVGAFRETDMLDLGNAEDWTETASDTLRNRLLPPDSALAGWPEVAIGADGAGRFVEGQTVRLPVAQGQGQVRVYGEEGQFLGVGEVTGDGCLLPRRIFKAG